MSFQPRSLLYIPKHHITAICYTCKYLFSNLSALDHYAKESHKQDCTFTEEEQNLNENSGAESDDPDHTDNVLTMHHGHSHAHCKSVPKTVASIAWMVVLGDGIHNFSDGLAIGAAYSNSITGGISTSIAVFCHELPHEIGKYTIVPHEIGKYTIVHSAMVSPLERRIPTVLQAGSAPV